VNFFNHHAKERPDVVVITRGGGSVSDLSWFDNKKIAAAIAASKIPVFTALGHQTDVTVADLIAHSSFKTPTKVAQYLVESVRGALEKAESVGKEILDASLALIDGSHRGLQARALRVDSLIGQYFRDQSNELTRLSSLIANNSLHYTRREAVRLDEAGRHLALSLKKLFQNSAAAVQYIEEKINLLNPRTILKRGYSISRKDGKMVRSAAELTKGDVMTTIFYRGQASSRVQSINEEDND
jgi:exodeoxyribonuclease VII large subunit